MLPVLFVPMYITQHKLKNQNFDIKICNFNRVTMESIFSPITKKKADI